MSIRVLVGASGAGKTSEVISLINDLRARKQRCFLIASLDGGLVRDALARFDVISARSGKQVRVDFKGTIDEIREFVRSKAVVPSTFVFDEAHRLGDSFIRDWLDISKSGSSAIVSTPSPAQFKELKSAGALVTNIRKLCDLMADGDGTEIIRLPGSDATISVCEKCATHLRGYARKNLFHRLVATEPYPGKKEIYQPFDVDYPEYAELSPIREDSGERANIMKSFVDRHIGKFEHHHRSYIDIGCNSGYFCKKMADLGFQSTGVDIAKNDIQMGKVADSYFYNRHLNLICKNAVDYVPNEMPEHDVVSTFSVYQWMFAQGDPDPVYASLRALMKKTKKLFFFEMGYTKEAHYKNRLTVKIDRDWCLAQMRTYGNFAEIITFEEGERGLKRDFFVGIR